MQVAWRGRSHLEPPARAQVAHVLQPSRQVWRGGAGGLEGGEATWRHPSGHMATGGVWNLLRCFLHCLPMATGGVSHLLQVLFALFCPCPQAA